MIGFNTTCCLNIDCSWHC